MYREVASRAVRIQDSITIVTCSFVPTKHQSTLTLPTLSLFSQPLVGSLFFQLIKILDDIKMMNPAIALKSPDSIAGKFNTKTAVWNTLSLSTGSYRAFRTSRVNISPIRSTARTSETL
jgi:hypothetical protein